ncbi:MAG TPA: c-type cytochrome [Gaiellaceae bacterium]|nr:c-type cytochrome [Gaiellaceae bacterium]
MRRLALLALVLALPATAAAEPNGRQLFVDGCASCHGFDARGVPGVGPDLHGAGAAAADFYLSTGRMPLDVATGEQPLRGRPAYPPDEIRALVRYVGSLGGPKIPQVQPKRGDLSEGQHAFASYCAGCHQILGQGGVVTGAVPPALTETSPTQLAEAVRVGPYLMPAFDERQIDRRTLDSIALYVQEVVQDPPDRGGWPIGHIGPIPEGMVAWLLAGGVLLLVARVIGERMQR